MDTSPHKAMYSQFLQPVVPLNVTSFLREYALHMEYLEYEFEDPTDLATIARDIGSGRIRTYDQFRQAVRHMFHNAMEFTASGDLHDYAKMMLEVQGRVPVLDLTHWDEVL